MLIEKNGKVIKGLGGLYSVRVYEDGKPILYPCKAKGVLRRDDEKVLIGDNVTLTLDESTPDSVVISEIKERKNSLIRPPLANLDYLFIVFAAAKPAPVIETVDKLISIAEYNGIEVAIVITKNDINEKNAEELADIYRSVGIPTFVTSSETMEGIDGLKEYIDCSVTDGKTAAFAGASGVGKSTLMNRLFPSLSLATSDISHKIERGKHTTRHVEMFSLSEGENTGYLADTPGFSLIDFSRFDFFPIESLENTFREFREYVGGCRYADCAHVGEGSSDCAVMRAAEAGKIPKTRLQSYRSLYVTLKAKKNYD